MLSKHEILRSEIQDYSKVLWRDLPGAELPAVDGEPFPSDQAQAAQRLSSTGHWVVPVATPIGHISLMTFHASPPVFDGPEDRNGLRNRDEIRLWSLLMDGDLGPGADEPLRDRRGCQSGSGFRAMGAKTQSGRFWPIHTCKTRSKRMRPARWQRLTGKAAGKMRVDYVLPSADLKVMDAGVFWPAPNSDLRDAAQSASRHRLVWVDVAVP